MTAGSDRLERTRLAILEHVHRKELRRRPRQPDTTEVTFAGDVQADPNRPRPRRAGTWVGQARDMVDDWWRYHPIHMAVDLARPALASYSRRKPMQYLGIAAVAGVALFLLRPWKLISATGLLVALVKSPQVASLVMSAMSSSQNPRDDEPLDT